MPPSACATRLLRLLYARALQEAATLEWRVLYAENILRLEMLANAFSAPPLHLVETTQGGELEPDDEAYPLLHGYNFFTSGNPMTVWADHIGIHLEFWGVFHDHGAWRGSCAHLDAALAGKASLAKAKQQCSAGGWRFHRSGSWRILGWGCAKLKDHFPPWQPRTFFGDPDIDE